MVEDEPIRIAKWIAMAGICSRRSAEEKIRSNRVLLNDVVVEDVGTTMRPYLDRVSVDGSAIRRIDRSKNQSARPATQIWIAHKMKGELVTSNDPQGRPTIFERLQKMGLSRHLMPVGRLDFNTEGLLLLTNDGDYARRLEHPQYAVQRTYHALVRGSVLPSKIEELSRGATINGIRYRPIEISLQSKSGKDSWLQVKIREGKNREIRKAFTHVRLIVKRLIRVQFGTHRLGKLAYGSVLETRAKMPEELAQNKASATLRSKNSQSGCK